MARIKAKPMNRLPIPATVPTIGGAPTGGSGSSNPTGAGGGGGGGAGGAMKNGFRSPPVYETTGFQNTPRYVYSNGSGSASLPPGVTYPNQVHVLVSIISICV